MPEIKIYEDPLECQQVWEKAWPHYCLFDLWQVRDCFATSYKRTPYFLVAEEKGIIEGLLALTWIDEEGYFAHYPGETWNGKTWLEQNRIPARSPEVFFDLLESVPGATHLRYLTRESIPAGKGPVAVDEVGYIFNPSANGFSFQAYMQQFSGKSRKKLSRELSAMENLGVAYRYNNVEDIQWLFRTNLESFQETSYFYDPRFLNSFEKLVVLLNRCGMLRITTLLLGNTIAAVDVGAVWKKTYTVLAGATSSDFPGVTKMINFHHLEWSCQERIELVDFLCGDFGWKQRFHLTPRPLYEMHIPGGLRTKQETETFQVHAVEQ